MASPVWGMPRERKKQHKPNTIFARILKGRLTCLEIYRPPSISLSYHPTPLCAFLKHSSQLCPSLRLPSLTFKMCEKIKMVYDCGHYSGVEVWKPPNPADCQAAVSANRRCQITNTLLHCPTEWATYRCKIPGWCQGTLVCKLKNLQESGFSCCICNRRSLGRECACSHPACINCETLIE